MCMLYKTSVWSGTKRLEPVDCEVYFYLDTDLRIIPEIYDLSRCDNLMTNLKSITIGILFQSYFNV